MSIEKYSGVFPSPENLQICVPKAELIRKEPTAEVVITSPEAMQKRVSYENRRYARI